MIYFVCSVFLGIFDFTEETKTDVVFRSDQSKLCVNFTLTVDEIFERPERFGVSFTIKSSPDEAVPSTASAVVTILDGEICLKLNRKIIISSNVYNYRKTQTRL